MTPVVTLALTDDERREALEAARWYVTGVVSELSICSIGLIARLVLESTPLPRSPRTLTALPHSSSRDAD